MPLPEPLPSSPPEKIDPIKKRILKPKAEIIKITEIFKIFGNDTLELINPHNKIG